MTDATTITIPKEIIAQDQKYNNIVKNADGSLKSAKEQRAAAVAELNQFRWEMTVCEHGPQISQTDYAAAVGQNQATISRGVAAWQATLDADTSMHGASFCCYTEQPHHELGPKTKPTAEQSASHTEQRRKAEHGEIKAAAIEMIAVHFGVDPNTVERHYRPLVKEAVARLHGGWDTSDMTIEEAKSFLNEIARVLKQEDKLRQRREGDVKRWMAENRGVSVQDIKAADIASKMDRIETVAARKEISWDEAATEVREADRKASEAAKMKNEMAKAARLAILDLMEAARDVKAAAIKVASAVRAIEDSNIVITDDERTISVDDLDQAEAALHLARAALTGDSGTDWDAALASLNQNGGK